MIKGCCLFYKWQSFNIGNSEFGSKFEVLQGCMGAKQLTEDVLLIELQRIPHYISQNP